MLRDERVTSVLIGASSVAQLDDNLAALDNLDLADELDAIEQDAVDSGINLWAAVLGGVRSQTGLLVSRRAPAVKPAGRP